MIIVKLAVITGADGGMGTEITRAAAKAGYRIVMACYRPEKAEKVKDMLVRDTGNPHIEVLGVDLSSLASVAAFAEILLKRGDAVPPLPKGEALAVPIKLMVLPRAPPLGELDAKRPERASCL